MKNAPTIVNRSAKFHFSIESTYTAGIVLTGTEVKSLREGKASFNDTFCIFHGNELFIRNLYIAKYVLGTSNNHEPTRERKLLLNRQELNKILNKKKEKGYTIVPLKIYFNENGQAKIDIALAKGKKTYDKRESLKQKDQERDLKRNMRY
jgi:SsrA-binding protein